MTEFVACKMGEEEGWLICISGGSFIDDEAYIVEIRGVHGDEMPTQVSDAKPSAELIAKLLNEYYGFS